MKQTSKMSRAISQLEHIYNSLNTDFFDGELPMPIITVQSRPETMGHCSVAKVWKRKEDSGKRQIEQNLHPRGKMGRKGVIRNGGRKRVLKLREKIYANVSQNETEILQRYV